MFVNRPVGRRRPRPRPVRGGDAERRRAGRARTQRAQRGRVRGLLGALPGPARHQGETDRHAAFIASIL